MRRATLVAVVALGLSLAVPGVPDEKQKVPTYTNEDLRRVSPFRDQTGALSKPAVPFPSDPRREADDLPAVSRSRRTRGAATEVAYWRREVERLRERLRPLRERAAELRDRIEERRRQGGVRPYGDPRIQAWERRLRALEERIREAESLLEDRARREGAPPGWLR